MAARQGRCAAPTTRVGHRALLFACILAGVQLAADAQVRGRVRAEQEFIAPDWIVTAELIDGVRRAGSLYSVDMYFDNVYDSLWAGELRAWTPPTALFWLPGYWKQYLDEDSALGILGPLGPTGPLGASGAIGHGQWEPSDDLKWFSLAFKWMNSFGGSSSPERVYGPSGPLGEAGPLSPEEVYKTMYHLNAVFGAQDFPINLDITGVWGILGPLGPLGALGPLGPLGPMGPHELEVDSHGNFRHAASGAVVRTQAVQFDRLAVQHRVYHLYENYDYAAALSGQVPLDTSWMVEGYLGLNRTSGPDSGITDVYAFVSNHSQVVSVLVLPIVEDSRNTRSVFGDFDVEVRAVTRHGPHGVRHEPVARSALASSRTLRSARRGAKGYVDFVIFKAEAGARYEATVSGAIGPLGNERSEAGYRLLVTGTGFHATASVRSEFTHLNIYGPHQGTRPLP